MWPQLLCALVICLGTLSSAELIDLTHSYEEKIPIWPGGRQFEVTSRREGMTEDGHWFASYDFCTAEHSGTHMDAPFHFAKDKWTVDEIPEERLLVRAVVVDISGEARGNPLVKLGVGHLVDWEKKNGEIPFRSVVVMRSGWSRYWGNATLYFGSAEKDPKKFRFPTIDSEAAQWLVYNRGISGVVVDTASVDIGGVPLSHRIFSKDNVYCVENAAHLDELPPAGATLIVMPMKIRKGTGAPCRLMAHLGPFGNDAPQGLQLLSFPLLCSALLASSLLRW